MRGLFRPDAHVERVDDHETREPRDGGNPQEHPGNMRGHLLSPRTCRPLNEIQVPQPKAFLCGTATLGHLCGVCRPHARPVLSKLSHDCKTRTGESACATYACIAPPRIARFTRLRSSGTLKPLYCSGSAPRMAICPAISAVSFVARFSQPLRLRPAVNRTGCAATPFTAMRMRWIVLRRPGGLHRRRHVDQSRKSHDCAVANFFGEIKLRAGLQVDGIRMAT